MKRDGSIFQPLLSSKRFLFMSLPDRAESLSSLIISRLFMRSTMLTHSLGHGIARFITVNCFLFLNSSLNASNLGNSSLSLCLKSTAQVHRAIKGTGTFFLSAPLIHNVFTGPILSWQSLKVLAQGQQ